MFCYAKNARALDQLYGKPISVTILESLIPFKCIRCSHWKVFYKTSFFVQVFCMEKIQAILYLWSKNLCKVHFRKVGNLQRATSQKNELLQRCFSNLLAAVAEQLLMNFIGGCFCHKFATNAVTNNKKYHVFVLWFFCF